MTQLHTLCCTITVPLFRAYIEAFTIYIVLLTSYTLHICISMWAQLARAQLARMQLARVQLARVQLARVQLARVQLARVQLARAHLARAHLTWAQMTGRS
jgi:uncharacterized protein YjbI with pentapeptide repeats